jgi:acetaldehyde dehydrogenase/alcohol dehydrogenase
LFLPYTIEFTAAGGDSRYADIARFLGLPAQDETQAASNLVAAIRELMQQLDQPTTLRELDITPAAFEEGLPHLIANAESDTSLVMSTRIPDTRELERVFRCAYDGKSVDF